MKLENSGEVQVGVIQISREEVSRRQIRDICDALRTNSLSVLALRECSLQDGDYKKLIKAISVCDGLLQLNFNVNVVNSDERVNLLAKCLKRTKSLKSLYLHGSDLSGENAEILCRSLRRHPSIISLDLGDCKLNDDSVEYIIPLLEPKGRFQGLVELGLSGNTLVTGAGWCRLFQALALSHESCRLSSLYLDYCNLGNKALTCLATALASLDTVRTLDLENTSITDEGAQFLLYLAENKKPNSLTTINLLGNGLDAQLIEAIQTRLLSSPTPSSVESDDSDSEYEMRLSTGMNILKDPAKIQALETLTKALNAYSRTFDGSAEPSEEDSIDKQEEQGQESSPVDLNTTSEQPQANTDEQGETTVPEGTLDDQALEVASQISEKSSKGAKSSLSSLSDQEDDFDDVIEADKSNLNLAERAGEDQGEFLKEIPIMQNYSVIQPVRFLSRASAGYLF